MKKIITLSLSLICYFSILAQPCNSSQDAYNTPTVCTKKYLSTNIENLGTYMPTKEQDVALSALYASVIEPAIKSTKGFKGKWELEGALTKFPKEKIIRSAISMYMNLLVCTKDHKLTEKNEAGLVLHFLYNSLWEIADACEHQEKKWEKDNAKTIYIDEKIEGRQIYMLRPPTADNNYSRFTYYRKEGDGEYFVISKPGVPLFLPLTIKQALSINRQNCLNRIEEDKQQLLRPGLKPATRADYEKDKEMINIFEVSKKTPNPEKFINDFIKQMEELKMAEIKQTNENIALEKKAIKMIDDYMSSVSEKELNKPYFSRYHNLYELFDSEDKFKQNFTSNYGSAFVTLNPAYLNAKVSPTAPQFATVALEVQGDASVIVKGYYDFKANLNLDKIIPLLVK